MSAENTSLDSIPAIGISVNAQIAENRSIVLQAHVPITMGVGELHQLMDKLESTVARQQLHHEILVWEAELEKRQARLEELEAQILHVDSVQNDGAGSSRALRKNKALSEKEAAERENAIKTARFHAKDMQRVAEGLATRRARLNGLPITTDSVFSSSAS